jgi:hypothetical protein
MSFSFLNAAKILKNRNCTNGMDVKITLFVIVG